MWRPRSWLDTCSVLSELGKSLHKISAFGHQVMHRCLRKDPFQALELAMEHTMNVSYVGTRILVNGRDVCK